MDNPPLNILLIGFIAIVGGLFGVTGNAFMGTEHGELAVAYLIGASGLMWLLWMGVYMMATRVFDTPLVEVAFSATFAGIWATGGFVDWSAVPLQNSPTGFTDIWLIPAVGLSVIGLLKTEYVKSRLSPVAEKLDSAFSNPEVAD